MTPLPDSISLIGMPAVGKSTVGVLLAKALVFDFLDTDVGIQARHDASLQQIIQTRGLDEFRRLEQAYILTLNCRRKVIATGGSVVYGEQAMAHLKRISRVIHLDLPAVDLQTRIGDIDARGVVRAPGQSLAGLYRERLPLYRQYADVTVDSQGLSPRQTLTRILENLKI